MPKGAAASDGDFALQRIEHGRELGAAGGDQLGRLLRRGTSAFGEPDQQEVHHAVAERLAAQGFDAGRWVGGEQSRATVQAVEIFADDAQVVERAAVIEDQRGQLVERIQGHHLGIGLGGRDDDLGAFDAVREAGLVREDHDLAHEGRAR